MLHSGIEMSETESCDLIADTGNMLKFLSDLCSVKNLR